MTEYLGPLQAGTTKHVGQKNKAQETFEKDFFCLHHSIQFLRVPKMPRPSLFSVRSWNCTIQFHDKLEGSMDCFSCKISRETMVSLIKDGVVPGSMFPRKPIRSIP